MRDYVEERAGGPRAAAADRVTGRNRGGCGLFSKMDTCSMMVRVIP